MWALLRLVRLHLQSEPDLNQKFHVIIVPNTSSVPCTSSPALYSKWQMVYGGMQGTLSPAPDQSHHQGMAKCEHNINAQAELSQEIFANCPLFCSPCPCKTLYLIIKLCWL